MVEDKAHRLGIRISHVNSFGTSTLAFDGSGRVKRGRESQKTDNNYSVCEFTSGKVYNCDLNASYNIGAVSVGSKGPTCVGGGPIFVDLKGPISVKYKANIKNYLSA